MTRRKVLICGASGFIGRNLFIALSERDDLDVWGTYRTRRFTDSPKLVQADFTRPEDAAAALKGCDTVIHTAAVSTGAKDVAEQPYLHVTDNVVMNSILHRAAHEANVKQFVFFSCTYLYPQDRDIPVSEADLDLNAPLYDKYIGGGWMKLYGEKSCEFYAGLGRTRFTAIRHSNIYGPHDKYNSEKSHVFAATVSKVMTAPEGGEVLVWGTGSEKRDLLHISDLVRFVQNVIDHQDYGFDVFNVGYGEAISVGALVEKTVALSGKRLSIRYDPTKPTFPTKIALNCDKARQKFGWQPRVSLDDGIRLTLDWYRTHAAPNAGAVRA